MGTLHHPTVAETADTALFNMLTAPTRPTAKSFLQRRDAVLDPLLIAAAAASGPHVTRNHYHHDFFPGVAVPQAEGAWDWTKWSADDSDTKSERKRLAYVSRQTPRRQRLAAASLGDCKENKFPHGFDSLQTADNLSQTHEKHPSPLISTHHQCQSLTRTSPTVQVKCMARTRVPTPHGPVFLHLYHNNHDNKEHLAIVIDPAQFSEGIPPAIPIRSHSLDAAWSENETEMDRIARGAYVGRLSPTSQHASDPSSSVQFSSSPLHKLSIPPPLIRIHSECFTGETIGSMRCDCGEQLDEAIRQISLPITIPSDHPSTNSAVIPGRGAIIYLRQEGRGIGLLSKIRAYNLQDLGHDTVTANLMLGHKADERGYEIAAAILRDLSLDLEGSASKGVRVLTNNPDKVKALEKEGIRIAERVPMIPRSWQKCKHKAEDKEAQTMAQKKEKEKILGATLIGGNAVHGEDLDKYLRTKVLRMGHMLPLWLEDTV